jgi:hypothetical protein
LAASKWRKRKKELECELQSKTQNLLSERYHMQKINDSLNNEILELQRQIRRHGVSHCGVPLTHRATTFASHERT